MICASRGGDGGSVQRGGVKDEGMAATHKKKQRAKKATPQDGRGRGAGGWLKDRMVKRDRSKGDLEREAE